MDVNQVSGAIVNTAMKVHSMAWLTTDETVLCVLCGGSFLLLGFHFLELLRWSFFG